jgi:hypothetical protein
VSRSGIFLFGDRQKTALWSDQFTFAGPVIPSTSSRARGEKKTGKETGQRKLFP